MRRAAIMLIGLFIALFAATGPSMAAGSCDTKPPVSDAQRERLKQLPPELALILKAVQKSRTGACTASGGRLTRFAAVDPGGISLPPQVAAADNADALPDEVVALIAGDGAAVDAIATANNLTVRSRRVSGLLNGTLVRFGIPDGRTPAEVARALQAAGASLAEPNHLYRLQGSAYDDSRYDLSRIGLADAPPDRSGNGVLVGVIDTAVDENHPDLAGAIADRFDGLDGQSVVSRSHGTAVAGLIAGRSLIRGVAPAARLLVARAFDAGGSGKGTGTGSALLASLDWLVEHKARIINMSFSGPRNRLLSVALSAAADAGVLLVAAAGNEGPDAPWAYPAAEPSVLAVTATDDADKVYDQANNGDYVFIAAPGVDMLVAAPGGGIGLETGTSYAAPLVSGLAALLMQGDNGLAPRSVADRLAASAHDLGKPGRDAVYGVGLVDAARAFAE